ncbi:ABC transporter ATP-binding protein [Mesorhizobium sp. 8]|uniref:ABC transporter ATP-binding protein n=1 Tax=Mesorhizobium sp. 8 TaxID=2584466 RepID=UPI00111F856C|nr:ABC transporter ATP-binding protein [Mesorhizobium sp. 8]QDC02214.1 ABC transporter ATP-binding protein [Mesorhizobium sp. 8]
METTAAIEVSGLEKIFFNSQDGLAGGIRDVGFRLAPGTFFTLLGPSGCGKTTTLRCIAGLEQPDRGGIRVGAETLFDDTGGVNVPLNKRNIGMVFQSYAIWPHMTVFENVAFPLRVAHDRKYGRAEIESLTADALCRVGLDGYGKRSATRLSGGQQQRVALARAIVRQPRLLLLDEPLSNLDATLREEMRSELKRLQREVGVTTIYVTHDQSEALEMSDLVAVMDKGRVVQLDAPRAIYFRPANRFVAGFVGATNLVTGTVAGEPDGHGVARVTVDGAGDIGCLLSQPVEVGQRIAVSIRPEAICLTQAGAPQRPGHSRLNGEVEVAGFLGNMTRYRVKAAGNSLQVAAGAETTFENGAAVCLDFREDAALGLPPDATLHTA